MDALLKEAPNITAWVSSDSPVILLVEGDPDTRDTLQCFFQHEGFNVIAANTLAEAEECITKRGRLNMAVIISHMHLDPVSNELDGYAFLVNWAAAESSLSYILIKDEHTIWDLPIARKENALFLAKPFTVRGLLSAVQLLLIK